MEEERDGISLGEIIRVIFSQKWLALIIAAVIALGVTVALYFGYNPKVTDYVSTFTVSFPGSDSGKFPDNSPFKFTEMVSRDNMDAAKSSNLERFGYIEVGTIYVNNDISITHTVGQQESYYTIRVSAKYFKSRSDATDFVDALTQMPVNTLLKIADARDIALTDFDNTNFYEDKIDILETHVKYLIVAASELVESTGNLSKNVKLLNDIKKYDTELRTTVGKMRQNLYVHDIDEVRSAYTNLLYIINADIAKKTREMELIFGRLNSNDPTVDIVQASERVEQLASEISELEDSKEIYSAYLYGKDSEVMKVSEEFYNELVALGDRLEELTGRYADNLREYYIKYSFVAYTGALDKEGNLGIIVCVLIGVIAGAVVAAAVAFIVGIRKLKKSDAKDKNSQDPQDGSAQEN